MSAPKRDDAGFRWTIDGQDFMHFLGAKLKVNGRGRVETIYRHQAPDPSSAPRVIRIGTPAREIDATIIYDGQPETLESFLADGVAGASVVYFPSLSNPSESYPCIVDAASSPTLVRDPDFWHEFRWSSQVRLRRIDGGSWDGVTTPSLFYYTAGNPLPGLTFSRSGAVGKYVDELGVVQDAAANVARTTWIDGVPYLLIEPARTNLVDSDDLTAWTGVNTPTVTGSVDDPAGGTGAYTVQDADGAANEYVFRNVTFVGDGTTTVVFVVRENTMPAAGNQLLRVYDSTVAAVRLQLGISAWVAGEPTVTASGGTYIGKRYVGNGYWAIYGEATGVVVGNTNRVSVWPAGNTAETGLIDVWRVNAWSDNVPGFSFMDASESRPNEAFEAALSLRAEPMSCYVRLRETGAVEGAVGYVIHLGDSAVPRLRIYANGSGVYAARWTDANGGDATATLAVAPSWGDDVELLATVDADGVLTLSQRINGATATTATDTATALSGFPMTPEVHVGSLSGSTMYLGLYRAIRISRGVRTLAEMAA